MYVALPMSYIYVRSSPLPCIYITLTLTGPRARPPLYQIFKQPHPAKQLAASRSAVVAAPTATWSYDVISGFNASTHLDEPGCVLIQERVCDSDGDAVLNLAAASDAFLQPRYYQSATQCTQRDDVAALAAVMVHVYTGMPMAAASLSGALHCPQLPAEMQVCACTRGA